MEPDKLSEINTWFRKYYISGQGPVTLKCIVTDPVPFDMAEVLYWIYQKQGIVLITINIPNNDILPSVSFRKDMLSAPGINIKVTLGNDSDTIKIIIKDTDNIKNINKILKTTAFNMIDYLLYVPELSDLFPNDINIKKPNKDFENRSKKNWASIVTIKERLKEISGIISPYKTNSVDVTGIGGFPLYLSDSGIIFGFVIKLIYVSKNVDINTIINKKSDTMYSLIRFLNKELRFFDYMGNVISTNIKINIDIDIKYKLNISIELQVSTELIKNDDYQDTLGYYRNKVEKLCERSSDNREKLISEAKKLMIKRKDMSSLNSEELCEYLKKYVWFDLKYNNF